MEEQVERLRLLGYFTFGRSHDCGGRAGPGDSSIRLTLKKAFLPWRSLTNKTRPRKGHTVQTLVAAVLRGYHSVS